jgi:hypothetical protein
MPHPSFAFLAKEGGDFDFFTRALRTEFRMKEAAFRDAVPHSVENSFECAFKIRV